MIPSALPANLVDHPLYPALTTAVSDLATGNIMTALMLTGLILLQVGRFPSASRRCRTLTPEFVQGREILRQASHFSAHHHR